MVVLVHRKRAWVFDFLPLFLLLFNSLRGNTKAAGRLYGLMNSQATQLGERQLENVTEVLPLFSVWILQSSTCLADPKRKDSLLSPQSLKSPQAMLVVCMLMGP